jgi:hypothetical protein
MLGTLLIVIWGILTCTSQYFLSWITFTPNGLKILGVVGLVGFALWLFSSYYRHTNPNGAWWF